MSDRVRLEWTFLEKVSLFKVTSPDIKGLCITAKSKIEAQREVLAVLEIMRAHSGQQGWLSAVDFETA